MDADLEIDRPSAPKGWAGGLSDLDRERGERQPQDMFLKSIECASGDGDTVMLPPHMPAM